MVRSVILQLSPLSGTKKKKLSYIFSHSQFFKLFLHSVGVSAETAGFSWEFSSERVRDKQIWSNSKTDKQLFHRLQHFSHSEKTQKSEHECEYLSCKHQKRVLNQHRRTRGKKSGGKKNVRADHVLCHTWTSCSTWWHTHKYYGFCFSGLLGAIFSLSRLLHD